MAVIGVGHLGSSHARLYHQASNTDLVGICDIDKKRASEIARRYQTAAYTDYRELISQVEAASIVVPTKLHHKIAKDFITGGVHLLIEKPITENLKQASSLLRLARKHKVMLQVGHVERFNEAVAALKKIITRPVFIECHRLGRFSPRGTDVGVVLDLMIHDLDIILHLVKDRIKKVEAVGVKVLSGHEDIANARLSFQKGTVCNVTASRVSQESIRKIRIFQPDTYVSLDYVNQEAHIYRKKAKGIIKKSIDIKRQEPLKAELAAFIRSVASKKTPVVSGEDAREALKLALKISKKIKSSKAYV